MRFLVFIPRGVGSSPRDGQGGHPTFGDVGLECLTGDGEPSPEMVDVDSFAPAGQPGRIYGWPEGLDGLPIHQPDVQTWIAAAPDPDRKLAAKRYWLGLWNESPPTAGDLERVNLVPGRAGLKARSGTWRIPSLLNLPCSVELDETTGRPVRVPKPEFAQWRLDAAWGLDLTLKLLRGESIDWSLDQTFEVAVRLLQLNYRLPRELVHRLGLLADETNVHAVLMHAADARELDRAIADIEAKKKAGPVTSGCLGSSAGGAG